MAAAQASDDHAHRRSLALEAGQILLWPLGHRRRATTLSTPTRGAMAVAGRARSTAQGVRPFHGRSPGRSAQYEQALAGAARRTSGLASSPDSDEENKRLGGRVLPF